MKKEIFSGQDAVYEIVPSDSVRSGFEDFESYFSAKSFSEESMKLIWEKYNSRFVNFELNPGIYEMIHINSALIDLTKLLLLML